MADRFIYSPETIIKAYSLGVFPMASAHDADEIYFYEPDMRGILPFAATYSATSAQAGSANRLDSDSGSRFSGSY